jgi:hypothetical protein
MGHMSPRVFNNFKPLIKAAILNFLNSAPPKREWVGLTTEEAAICWTNSEVQSWKNIEAKLKEKNT